MRISKRKLKVVQGLVFFFTLAAAVILRFQNMDEAFWLTLIAGNAVNLLFNAAIYERKTAEELEDEKAYEA